jgi:hypothetical protein
MAKKSATVAAPTSVAAGAGTSTADLVSAFVQVASIGVGTYQVQQSFNGGTTWVNKSAALTADGAVAIDDAANAVRLNCTAYTSGTPAAVVSGLKTSQYEG